MSLRPETPEEAILRCLAEDSPTPSTKTNYQTWSASARAQERDGRLSETTQARRKDVDIHFWTESGEVPLQKLISMTPREAGFINHKDSCQPVGRDGPPRCANVRKWDNRMHP